MWTKSAGGDQAVFGYSVATDRNGDVFLTGYFQGDSVQFGQTTLYTPVSGATYANYFIAKYSMNGAVLWAKGFVATDSAYINGQSVAVDNSGNAFVTGNFSGGIINAGGNMLVDTTINTNSIFIVKYDSNGNILWAKSNGENYAAVKSMAVDRNSNIYITGAFYSDSIIFGAYILVKSFPVTLPGDVAEQYFFLTKYDSLGNVLWAKGAGNGNSSIGYCAATDLDGNVYVSGGFYGESMTFDSTLLLQTPNANDPMFFVAFDAAGNILCSSVLPSGGDDQNAICVDRSGNAYIASDFEFVNPLVIGGDSLPLTRPDCENVFVAKFNCGVKITGIINLCDNYFLQLYPNPFTNQATVKYSLPDGSKNASLIIYDILAQERSSYPLNNTNDEITINANNLSSGIYLYSLVVNGKTMATQKMVVQE